MFFCFLFFMFFVFVGGGDEKRTLKLQPPSNGLFRQPELIEERACFDCFERKKRASLLNDYINRPR